MCQYIFDYLKIDSRRSERWSVCINVGGTQYWHAALVHRIYNATWAINSHQSWPTAHLPTHPPPHTLPISSACVRACASTRTHQYQYLQAGCECRINFINKDICCPFFSVYIIGYVCVHLCEPVRASRAYVPRCVRVHPLHRRSIECYFIAN